MVRTYVEELRIENFGCARYVEFRVTPLHALIGPNDSGKSIILRAVRDGRAFSKLSSNPKEYVPGTTIQHRRLLRLDPDELRRPHTLIPNSQPIWFQSERGLGLGSIYDALLRRSRKAFSSVEDRFQKLFPQVKALRLDGAGEYKTIALTLVDGTEIGAQDMSEGMLYWLAFASIQYVSDTDMLLIEDPERGLHPAHIAKIVQILREVSETTQVLMATHSPLVINELTPEEVTLVTRPEDKGTICTPLSETQNFVKRSTVYALGELWLAYADGDLEEGLVAFPDADDEDQENDD